MKIPDIAGEITISPSRPRVGEDATASLRDEDGGVNSGSWTWRTSATGRSDAAGGVAEGAQPRTVGQIYLVRSGDVGRYLKATRDNYNDNHGTGKQATGFSDGTVRPNKPKAPPDFDAVRGDGQVTLSWGAADGQGAAIDRYNYRYRAAGGSWPGYRRITSLTKTITGLTNGTTYDFQVRAHNSEGFGPPSTDSATPAGAPDTPSGFSHGRSSASQLRVEWDQPADNGSAITAYYWSKKVGSLWTNDTSTGTSTYFTASASNSVSHTYRVRAMNGVGSSGYGEYTVPAEERSASKPVAAFADSTGFGILTAPNPFNSQTLFHLALPEDTEVTLSVHSITGQTVAPLYDNSPLEAGLHTLEWQGVDDRGRPVGSGIYLFRVIAGGQVRVGKLALIR